jgi:hypothetical protein
MRECIDSYRRGARRARIVSRAAVALLVGCASLAAPPLPAQQIVGGLHFAGPVRASLAVGAAWSLQTAGSREHGPFLLVEPGLRGHRASAGYLVMFGNLGSFVSARGSWLQLRRDGDRRRYLGVELQVAPIFVTGVRVGGFLPTGSAGDRHLLWIADVSLAL